MVEYNLAKVEVEDSSPFFHLIFYLLGLRPCFHKDKVVVTKQAESNTKRK